MRNAVGVFLFLFAERVAALSLNTCFSLLCFRQVQVCIYLNHIIII